MRIVENPVEERELIESIMKKHGHTPDHNFDWLMYCSDEGEPRVAIWDAGYAIWYYKNRNGLVAVSDPIAPVNKYQEVVAEFLKTFFDPEKQIRFLDLRDEAHDIVRNLYTDNYKFDYDIVWPVVDMHLFDPELPGGHFKDIRNALSKFNREHGVGIKDANLVDKNDLHGIVDRWLDDRTKAGIEELFPVRYHNMIDGNFRGTKSARVMFVDGKAVGFNAGWETPNKPNEWSAAIGIHDFSVKDLGVVLFVEDLNWIKNAGYKTCDLEGSDPQALWFKTQFFSKFNTYKTYTFWLTK
ncbi:MAG TPA: phosphatidylglycerol lysyltransferase domain-containing protein [Candidatus Paceibacterota bacterium]